MNGPESLLVLVGAFESGFMICGSITLGAEGRVAMSILFAVLSAFYLVVAISLSRSNRKPLT